jgi:hypothetical protein
MSDTLTLDKKNAIKIYNDGTAAEKALLEKLYGAATFVPDILEQELKFEDICRMSKRDPKHYLVTDDMPKEVKYGIFCSKICLIAMTLNPPDWVANYSNSNQRKWLPVFVREKSGFGFSYSHSCYGDTTTHVGSRFASQKISDYAGKTFLKEFIDVITHAQ